MDYIVNPHDGGTSVQMSGQFTFADTHNFKTIIDLVTNNQVKAFSLDFANLTFIDSAGMGILLLLRDECLVHKIPLSIHSTQGQVKKIFHISKFDQLFSIY